MIFAHHWIHDVIGVITAFGTFLVPVAAVVSAVYARQAKGQAKSANAQSTATQNSVGPMANGSDKMVEMAAKNAAHILEVARHMKQIEAENKLAHKQLVGLQQEISDHVDSERAAVAKLQASLDGHVEWELDKYLNLEYNAHAPLPEGD